MSFTGRVNVLSEPTKQFIGSVVLNDGVLVDSSYGQMGGKKALANLLMVGRSGNGFSIISEPELVSELNFSFSMKEQDFFKFKNDYFEQYDLLKKLKPASNLIFKLNPVKLDIYTPINSLEFNVMKLITTTDNSGEIYKKSTLLEFDVTKSLISLRRKGIILVKGTA